VLLLGQDGWADGRFGNYSNSPVVLNDSRMIRDLFQHKILGSNYLLRKMQELADKDAGKLREDLENAIKQHPKKIIVITHVPPFKEVCLYKDKVSGDDYLPFFSSKATGDVLTHVVHENPMIQFLVLCGHTHHECYCQLTDNLIVRVGGVEYSQPKVQDTIG
jgi:predicted phosphohydrolase